MLTRNRILLILIVLTVFDVVVWMEIAKGSARDTELYFLNVGQGDAELVRLQGGVDILIDGGPSNKVVSELGEALGARDRYIDLVVMTHPETDHYMGLIDVIKRYQIGALLVNGESGPQESFKSLIAVLEEKNIPVVVVGEGDIVTHAEDTIEILSPSKELVASAEPNDGSIVMRLISNGKTALFTGDIGAEAESHLQKYIIKSDVLKVAHHGSRFSSTKPFIESVAPALAVVEVGKNSYGHPTKDAMARIAEGGATLFRTDEDGMVKIVLGEKIRALKKK